MGYRYHARRACRRDVTIGRRITSLRACVGRVSRLARLPFTEVWSRYHRHHDLTTVQGIVAAIASLEAERDFWLGRHELFATWKWHRLRRWGCGPAPPEVAGPLYGVSTPPSPGLVVYVTWLYRPSSAITCRLVKKPLGCRATVQAGAGPCRVSGPFSFREAIAYVGRANESWRRAAEEFVLSSAEAVEL